MSDSVKKYLNQRPEIKVLQENLNTSSELNLSSYPPDVKEVYEFTVQGRDLPEYTEKLIEARAKLVLKVKKYKKHNNKTQLKKAAEKLQIVRQKLNSCKILETLLEGK